MSEVKRCDTLNLEHFITHLENNGLTPTGNIPLFSKCANSDKNVVGDNQDMPSITNNSIRLSKNVPFDKKDKFKKLG